MSAFVPVFTSAGRPVGVLELCEPGSASSLLGFTAIELLLRIVALIAMFSFGFYGLMQLLDIVLRPRSMDRSCRVLSCGREAARPVLFFVSLCAGLPVMLLFGAEEMRNLITIDALPGLLSGITALLPLCLYLVCFLLGWVLVRKTRERLTEAPSNFSLIAATAYTIALILLKDTQVFASVPIMNEWYIPLALIALSGLCYGVSYRTISKYQNQSDMLFGKDKYAYLCTALGVITGMILGAWLLDASGEAGVKVAMLLLNIAACAISIILLEDLDQTVDISGLSESKISSTAGLLLALIPMGLACGYVWVYLTGYLADNGYSITAQSIIMVAPMIAFCFGNRLRLRTKETQRGALCVGGVLAGLSYLAMVWTPDPVMAVVSCGILCLAVVFMSAGVYSSLLPGERGSAFTALVVSAVVGAVGFAVLGGFFAGRLCLLIISIVSVVMSLVFLGTKFPNRIVAPEYHDAIAGDVETMLTAPVYTNYYSKEDKKEEKKEEQPEEKEEAAYIPPIFGGLFGRKDKSEEKEPEAEPAPESASEPESFFMPTFEPETEKEAEPAPDPEPEQKPEDTDQSGAKTYNWDEVDVRITDVMSEFMSQEDTAEQKPAEETRTAASPAEKKLPDTEEPEAPIIIFPDDDEEDTVGYNPDGGALSQANEKLGADEGFIDFGL